MGFYKALLLLALLVALVLVVAESRDLAETSAGKENGVTTESSNTGGLDDAKDGGYQGGNGGYNGGYGGNGGGYNGGNGGYGEGNGGGYGGGRGGGCCYGCCGPNYDGSGCRRCCSYAGQAVDSAEP